MLSKQNSQFQNILFSTITGLLTLCAFPKINLFFLAWIALIPLVSVIMRVRLISSFFYGFFSGFIFNALGLYWLIPTLWFNTYSYAQTIIASCFLWIYLALYWGIWSICLNFSKNIVQSKLYLNIFIIIFSTCIWVLLEYVRTYLFTGFPWMLIGYSQFEFTEVIQIVEFTGVYGVSFLVVFCNLCFYFWITARDRNNYLYMAIVFIALCVVFGIIRLDKFRFFGDNEYSVVVVQPNINQYKKWNRDYKYHNLLDLEKYAFKISKIKPDLIVWPETVLAGIIPRDEQLYNKAKYLASISGGLNLIGSLYNDDYKLFNAVLAFEGKNNYKKVHKKNHLVPFGEMIPFRHLLFKSLKVFRQFDDFIKGNDANVFDNGRMCVGSIICSENFFPDISRNFVNYGAKVFTNHTNDAWFFNTAALHQHFIMNIFRAIENRKTVIVSANSGISGIIEASGIIVKRTSSSKNVLLIGKFLQNDFKTFYTKYGDLFIDLCAGLLFAIIIILCALSYKNNIIKFKK